MSFPLIYGYVCCQKRYLRLFLTGDRQKYYSFLKAQSYMFGALSTPYSNWTCPLRLGLCRPNPWIRSDQSESNMLNWSINVANRWLCMTGWPYRIEFLIGRLALSRVGQSNLSSNWMLFPPASNQPIRFRYFIFMVSFGQFPENGQRQMAYIIYLIKVLRNTDKKLNAGSYKCNNFFINVWIPF